MLLRIKEIIFIPKYILLIAIPMALILSIFFLKLSEFPFLFLSILINLYLLTVNILLSLKHKRFQAILILLILLEVFFFRFLGLIDRTIIFNNENYGFLEFSGLQNLVFIQSNVINFIWVNILTASFLLGILLAQIRYKNNNSFLIQDLKIPKDTSSNIFIFVTIIFLTLTGMGFLSWNESNAWSEDDGFQKIFQKSFLHLSIVLLLLKLNFVESFKSKIFIFSIIILLVMLTFLSGIRTLLIYSCVPLLVYFLLPVNLKKLIICSIFSIFILVAFGVMEAGRSFLSLEGINEIGNFTAWYLENSNSLGGVMTILRITMEYNSHIDIDSLFYDKWSTGSGSFGYGLTLLKPLFYPIPSGIWPEKPLGYSVEMAKIIYPDEPNLSVGAGIIGELHYNFGPVAPLAIIIFSYFFTKLILHAYNVNYIKTNFNSLLMISFIPLFLDFYRAPLSDSVLVLSISILSLLFLRTFDLRVYKK